MQKMRALDRESDALEELLADELENAIAGTLSERSPVPARGFAAQVIDTDLTMTGRHADAAHLGQGTAVLLLTRWIMAIQRSGAGPDPERQALCWVARCLGPECEAAAAKAAIMVDPASVIDEDLGEDLLPALLWLTSGLSAEYGDSDPRWPRSHEAPRPEPAVSALRLGLRSKVRRRFR